MSKHCWSFLLFIALIISALFSTPISTGRCDKPAGLQPRCSSDSVEFILHEGGELTPKSVHKRMIRGSVFHNAVQKRTDEDSTQTAKIGILNFEQLGDYILAGHGKRASRTPEPTKIRLPISTAVPMIPIGDDPGIEDSKDASPDNSGDWTEAMPINFNKRDDSEEHSASNTATLPLADDPEFHLCCFKPELCTALVNLPGIAFCFNETDGGGFHLSNDIRGSFHDLRVEYPNGTDGHINDLGIDYNWFTIDYELSPATLKVSTSLGPTSITTAGSTFLTFPLTTPTNTPWEPTRNPYKETANALLGTADDQSPLDSNGNSNQNTDSPSPAGSRSTWNRVKHVGLQSFVIMVGVAVWP